MPCRPIGPARTGTVSLPLLFVFELLKKKIHRSCKFLLIIAALARRNQIVLHRLASASQRDKMVHSQITGLELLPTMMADTFADFLFPPGGGSQFSSFFPLFFDSLGVSISFIQKKIFIIRHKNKEGVRLTHLDSLFPQFYPSATKFRSTFSLQHKTFSDWPPAPIEPNESFH